MLMTKADLPFTKRMLGYQVQFEFDDFGSVIATCEQVPDLRIRSPVVEHAIRDAQDEIMLLAAGRTASRLPR